MVKEQGKELASVVTQVELTALVMLCPQKHAKVLLAQQLK